MITGAGIDAVEIARFSQWHTYSDTKLRRIFTEAEITYCRSCPAKSAERFAARFATREALYKALCQTYQTQKVAFLTLCTQVEVVKNPAGAPEICINWQHLFPSLKAAPRCHLSLTHTDAVAFAWVILEEL